MEVVVLGVTNGNQEDQSVDDSCDMLAASSVPQISCQRSNVRFAVGFLPKCLAW